jgi:hypothetical protein
MLTRSPPQASPSSNVVGEPPESAAGASAEDPSGMAGAVGRGADTPADAAQPAEAAPSSGAFETPNAAACPAADAATEGKIGNTEHLQAQLGPQLVMIVVAGGADATRLAVDCGEQRSCAEREQALQEYTAHNRASQRCLRAFIAEIGGQATDEVFFGNSLAAMLTWEQVQRVAAHPHALSIEPDIPAPPP